ncbi:MAG: hypothetical protein ABL904_05930 [Hyphomicrobiaceae bacterium]
MSSALLERLGRAPAISPHWLIMAVLFVGALGIGYALLPGQVQRVAMLERDGQTQQALALLEKGFANGNRDIRSMMQLEAFYEQQGQIDKARTILVELQQRRPRDPNILKRAASFYKMTQDRPAYLAALRNQLAVRHSEETCRELIGILRVQGATAEEQAAIQSCRQHGYRRPDDLVRLASLVSVDGDFAQASALLRSVDDVRRLKNERERTQLISTLLELDQPREAYRRALRWLRGQRETRLALSLINLLANANKHDLGIELAREISVPGDAVSLAVAELMLDRGEPLAAKSYLRGWYEKAHFNSEDMISRFMVATLDAEDPDIAMVAGRRYGLAKLTQPDLVALAEALAATGRQADFEVVRAHIKPEVWSENPLLGAAAALQRGAPEAGQSLLSTVAVDELDEWRLSLWAKLMDRTGRTEVAAEMLRRMGVDAPAETQAKSVTVEQRMIRRPRRITRSRIRRAPIVIGKQKQNVAPLQQGTPNPFGNTVN